MIDIDATAFDQLEQRITLAIERIHVLSRERDQARERVLGLEQQVSQLQAQLRDRDAELESLRENSVPRADFEQGKREIERRVESLLQRFGELEEAGNG